MTAQPHRDTYMGVLGLRAQLSEYWADGRLRAPEGVDIDALMVEVDNRLRVAEELLRPAAGNIETIRAQCADAPHPPGGYVSTSCRHAPHESDPQRSQELHEYCKGKCKFCDRRCRCGCGHPNRR